MSVKIKCQACGAVFPAAEKYLGLQVKCPKCETIIQLPAAPSSKPQPPTPKPAAPKPSQAIPSAIIDPEPTNEIPTAEIFSSESTVSGPTASGPTAQGPLGPDAIAEDTFALKPTSPSPIAPLPVKSKRASRRWNNPLRDGNVSFMFAIFSLGGFLSIVGVVIGLIFPNLAIFYIPLMWVWFIGLTLASFLWFLVIAATEGPAYCLLAIIFSLFIPIANLYYLCTRWSETQKTFYLFVSGLIPLLISSVVMGYINPDALKTKYRDNSETASSGAPYSNLPKTTPPPAARPEQDSGPMQIRPTGQIAKNNTSNKSKRSGSQPARELVAWNAKPDPRPDTVSGALSSKAVPLGTFTEISGLGFTAPSTAIVAAMHNKMERNRENIHDHRMKHLRWLTTHDLSDGSVLGRIDLPENCELLAISPNGKMAVLHNKNTDCEIFVWSLEDNEELLRWNPSEVQGSAQRHSRHNRIEAVFIGNEKLLTLCGNRSSLTLWRLPQREPIFTKTGKNIERMFASPGGRYIIYAENHSFGNGSIRFLDAESGNEVGELACKDFWPERKSEDRGDGSNPVSPDGRRLALRSDPRMTKYSKVFLWDLSTGKFDTKIEVEGELKSLKWLGSRFLLAEASGLQKPKFFLIDPARKAIVWRFEIGGTISHVETIDGPDDRCWFKVTAPNKSLCYLMALDPITDEIRNKIDKAMPNAAEPLIAAGKKARIVVGEFNTKGLDPKMPDRVRDYLGGLLKKKNMTVAADAPLKIMVTCKSEPTKSGVFVLSKSRLGIPPMHGHDESAPRITVPAVGSKWRLALFDENDRIVWERNGSAKSNDCVGYLNVPEGKNKVDYVYKASLKGYQRMAEQFFFQDILPVSLYSQPLDDEGKPGLGSDEIDLMAHFKAPDDIDISDITDDESSFNADGNFRTSESSSRAQVQKFLIDVVAESKDELLERFKWFPVGKRPAVLVRWGFGIQLTGNKNVPREVKTARDVEWVIGEIGVFLGSSLENRIAGGDFGKISKGQSEQLSHVTILGVEKQDALIKAAQRQAIDVLLLADVTHKSIGLGGAKRVSMRFRLINARKGTVLWTSRPMNNSRKADKLSAHELADMIFEEIDAKYKLQEMPPLTTDAAKGRIKKLAGSVPEWKSQRKKERLLSFIIEARYYHSMGWISAGDALDAYTRVVGPEKAKLIADNDKRQCRKGLREWLKEK